MSETIKEIGLNRLGLNGQISFFRNLPVETLVRILLLTMKVALLPMVRLWWTR
ncbi:MAG: hypothetical protein Ct9H300mP9_4880 [Candidatus Neomarinimicrobiota bacterium]|nr:MAG: hypothetical protein Ct9H300mP9_4880 [Candidatus Neomarinimicrobiota bacterium]